MQGMRAEPTSPISTEERAGWDDRGFFLRRRFAPEMCQSMLDRAVALARAAAHGEGVEPVVVIPEKQASLAESSAEDRVAKIFRLHRDSVFAEFAHDGRVADIVAALLGPEIDVFLSQFIFKMPGAYGQPWHQDSFYFPFEPDRQVGVWLAVSEATLENGCLHVLPGSHREPVHTHVADTRPDALYGYVEIVDHDMSAAVPVLMQPGDLLVFDSHLMHRSTDNVSRGIRAAMVYHYSAAGTVDRTPPGMAFNDWVAVRRTTAAVTR